MGFRHFAVAAAFLGALAVPALAADKTITVLHVSEIAAQKAIWDQIAKDYNAAHPGVKVQFKYLENEAFKAKLPTMLQADKSRPDLFYSWSRRRHAGAGQGRIPEGRHQGRRLVGVRPLPDRGRRLQG